jgi:hypothetical protein
LGGSVHKGFIFPSIRFAVDPAIFQKLNGENTTCHTKKGVMKMELLTQPLSLGLGLGLIVALFVGIDAWKRRRLVG